jgi:hypothetical protein
MYSNLKQNDLSNMESKDDAFKELGTVKDLETVKDFKEFIPKSLASLQILDYKLKNVEINKESNIGKDGKDNYVVDFLFTNIFESDEYTLDMETHFDAIYNVILLETGIYLESIEAIDREEIHAWGTIYKEGEKYYAAKPDNTE